MTKGRWLPIVLAFLVINGCLDTYLTLHNKSGIARRTAETRNLALENRERARENRELALANCHAIGTVASVERRFIGRTEAQQQAVLRAGATFGLSPDQLAKAIDASKKSQALFLGELDALKVSTCTVPSPVAPPVVKPGKAHPKGSAAPPKASTPGISTGTRASLTPSPRTLPEHRRLTPREGLHPSSPRSAAKAGTPTSPPSPSPTVPPPTLPPPSEPAHGITVPLPCIKTAIVTVC